MYLAWYHRYTLGTFLQTGQTQIQPRCLRFFLTQETRKVLVTILPTWPVKSMKFRINWSPAGAKILWWFHLAWMQSLWNPKYHGNPSYPPPKLPHLRNITGGGSFGGAARIPLKIGDLTVDGFREENGSLVFAQKDLGGYYWGNSPVTGRILCKYT